MRYRQQTADWTPPRRERRGRKTGWRRVGWAVMLLMLVAGCGRRQPPLPDAGQSGQVAVRPSPGPSEEFQQMKVPPGQLTRVIPVGDAWPADDGPTYRSLCLRCHSVSQTSFAARDWRESLHGRAGILCGSCHGSHEIGFVSHPGPDRCLMCHAQEVEEFVASKHGPGRSTGMRCASCHDIHATDRGMARSIRVCTGCHLGSDHVQGFAASKMGEVRAEQPPTPGADVRAPDCIYCHMPESPIMRTTGDFRNDRVTLHDPAITVAKNPNDPKRLSEETIRFMLPLCESCHSERNARFRLENSDPLIRHWTPVGMPGEVRRRPAPNTPGTGVPGTTP